MTGEKSRKHLRLSQYDYGQAGGYFITICTERKARTLCSIGTVSPAGLSSAGAGRPIHLSSVGAGHPAGPVVELTEIGLAVDALIRGIPQAYPTVHVEKYVVMPNHIHLLLQIAQTGPAGCPAPTIPKIVGALKSMSVRRVGSPLWQRGYYDHVIRDQTDYLRIWNYIDTNPAKWAEDEYYVP